MPEIKLFKKHITCIRRAPHKPHAGCGVIFFQSQILRWYQKNKRDDLPWRFTNVRPVNAYHILVSEIMLQQTQVTRVFDKFPKFIKIFPTPRDLARAPLDLVLEEWQGMGYNRRALYLKQCAEKTVENHNGDIPSDPLLLQTLPGIGPYTAGAVSCFAFNKPVVFLDTNIRKLFIHYFFTDPAHADEKISDAQIFPLAKNLLYKKNPRMWNYALMDYGALALSRSPDLLARAKNYHKQSPFLGSARFFRSQIVQYLLAHKKASYAELQKTSPRNIRPLLSALAKEGLIEKDAHDVFVIKKTT